MSSNSDAPRPGKAPRGRKPGAKVPCDDCIIRASQRKEDNLELCDRCTAILNRPRKPPHTNAQAAASSSRRVRRQSHAIIDTALGIKTGQPNLPWSSDKQEQHALQFFITHSAPQLAGYFDSPFWQKMVLVAARHEPSVMHAVAAIGALHEKLLAGAIEPSPADTSQDRRTRFALEQCNKSIQHLINPSDSDKKPDLRLMLTTCVLFTCFEALQGNCQQAMIHATQGYKLLQQYAVDPENKRWDVGAFAVELNQLVILMRRLRTQSKGLMGKEFDIDTGSQPEQSSLRKPTHFADLLEARFSLEIVLNQITIFFLDLDLDDKFYDLTVSSGEKHLRFVPWLEAWEEAFMELMERMHPSMSANDMKAAQILKAHHLVAEILANVDLSMNELGWDQFQSKFETIVNLAAEVLENTPRSDTSIIEARWKTSGVFISSPSATLSFSLGIVDPLYEVVARCRDPSLRRRALELLATHPRQECMWSSWSAWKVGRFLLNLEEAGGSQPATPSDIPSERRISTAWLDYTPKLGDQVGSRPQVGYKRAVPRASTRYALNPGLFEWRKETRSIPNLNFATVASTEEAGSGSHQNALAISDGSSISPTAPSMPTTLSGQE